LGLFGETKLRGENAIIHSGCEYVIICTSWLYSAFGKNFLKTMQKLTAEKESIQLVFDQVGTPTYAHDLANVIYTIFKEMILMVRIKYITILTKEFALGMILL
jgi:dTDP-4-dehydrorhamnose reductase